jgi:hypothetical protein
VANINILNERIQENFFDVKIGQLDK